MDDLRHLGRAGKADTGDVGIAGERRADRRAIPRQKLKRRIGQPCLAHHLNGAGCNDRCLFGRFGQYRVACRKCRRDLAGKDRERKVPRADADKDATGLARFFQFQTFGLIRVVAQEIDGFADLGDPVEQGLTRFARGNRAQLGDIVLVEISDLAQDV